jgi:hypothetical protein
MEVVKSVEWLEEVGKLWRSKGLDSGLFMHWFSLTVKNQFMEDIVLMNQYVKDKLTPEEPNIDEEELYNLFSHIIKFVQLAKGLIKEIREDDENTLINFCNLVETVLSKDIPGLRTVLFIYFKCYLIKSPV